MLKHHKDFMTSIAQMADEVYQINVDNGWHDSSRTIGDFVALIHSELSELFEGFRHHNPPSEHIPEYSSMEEEAADMLIRLLDFCKAHELRLAGATLEKLEYNKGRGYKHGGKAV